MYLSELHIRNFRCIKDLEVEFHPGLNILIGENDTGKTAILDALRWCFELGSEQREFRIRRDDLRIDGKGKRADEIEFHLTFVGLSDEEQGIFIELLAIPEEEDSEGIPLDEIDPELQLHVRFLYDKDKDRFKPPRYWGGAKEGQSIPPEVLELIYCTYLGALRNAVRDLSPSRGNQLSQLFVKLCPDKETREELATQMHNQVKKLDEWNKLLNEGKKRIKEHLENITLEDAPQDADIDFVQREFRKIVEGLRVRIPIQGIKDSNPEESSAENRVADLEIWQEGLGYNNLIYTATVLGNLREKKRIEPSSYIAFLIEEPEAHLHPQLQNRFFRYMETIAGDQIQVFVTSHSPTITAKTHLDSLIVLSRNNEEISALPLRTVNMDPKHKKFLERFLDVTKSQLFFAKGVILVEGISEALLLPCFADLTMSENHYLERKGIEVVNINGVAFEPFAKLFSSDDKERRHNMRCVIITDDDRNPKTDEISARAKNAQTLSKNCEMLRTELSEYTFEYEIYLINEGLITKAYDDFHDRAKLKLDGADLHERALQFVEKIKKEKAEFAQYLAYKIKEDDSFSNFQVPEYIQNALKWVVDGNGNNSN